MQNERLTSTPPVHFSNMAKPNEREQELASVIRCNLVEMAGKVKPHNIISETSIRKAVGTSVDLPTPPSKSNVVQTQDSINAESSKTMIKEQPMEVN